MPCTSSSVCRHRDMCALALLSAALLLAGCGRSIATGDPAVLIAGGWSYFRQSEFVAATNAFDDAMTALDKHPDLPNSKTLRLQAMFGLAQSWDLGRRDDDATRGANLYHQIIQLAPDSDEAAWSMLALARQLHNVPVGQEPDFSAVRQAYQAVIDRYPNHPAAQEAFVFQQSTLAAQLDPDSSRLALASLTRFIHDHPDSKFISAAWGLIAICQTTLGDAKDGLAADIQAFETREVDKTSPYSDNAGSYWFLATTAEFDVGDFDTARKYYKLLIAEYPGDQRVFPAIQALKRMDQLEQKMRAELKSSASPKMSAALKPSAGGAHGS